MSSLLVKAKAKYGTRDVAFRAIPVLIALAVLAGFLTWQWTRIDPVKRGQDLNKRAWESTYTERGLRIPAEGPREGYWGLRLGAKVPHPELGWREPHVVIPGLVEFDSEGFQHFQSPAGDKRRVLIFGASVAFGAYASGITKTYFHVLGAELNSLGTPADVTVIASGAWRSEQEATALRLFGERFHPDVVVFLDGLNDLTIDRLRTYDDKVHGYLANMEHAVEISAGLHCGVLFVLQPSLAERARRSPLKEVVLDNTLREANATVADYRAGCEAIRHGLSARHRPPAVQFLDCSRAFDEESATTFTDLWHFSDRGHEILGKAMARTLTAMLAGVREAAMTAILGISAFYHDSAAALVVDGVIVAAAQEERFSRKKHDAGFPGAAVRYCLREGGVEAGQFDYIAFYEKPLAKFDRLLETYLAYVPRGFRSFVQFVPLWAKEKLYLRRALRRGVPGADRARLVFTDHHESHAASAFFPSPFEKAAILTLDGVGEWSTAAYGSGSGNRIQLSHHIRFPHSLGLLYSAFTYYCGFKVNAGEYKLMGLAPYGRPVYVDAIYKHMLDLKPDGSFRLNMEYFNYCQGLTMTSRRFHQLFGGRPRAPESALEQRHMDLAASIQAVTEEALLRIGRHVQAETGMRQLVLAGGVALNCVANGRLLREGPFERLWIQPAAGDAGGALGAALLVWYQLLEQPRRPADGDDQHGSFLGPRFEPGEIGRLLSASGARYERYQEEPELLREVAALLADGKVVGWFQGRMEFGPRALGARSILGDPRSPAMQATLNVKIKFRESFRPFAPSVLAEHASEWFGLEPGEESPYMLVVAPVLEHQRVPVSNCQLELMQHNPDLRRRVNVVRSTIPAVTHVDYSARIQTVDEVRNPRFYRLLKAFHALTGCPVLVNTSFNVRGEPIVCTPQEAYRCFLATDMDVLVMEDYVLSKGDAEGVLDTEARERHLAQFQLD